MLVFLYPGDPRFPAGAGLVRDSVTRTGTNTSAYIEDVYQAASQVTATIGLRWDRTQAWFAPAHGRHAAVPPVLKK